jgi:hypothetical protein
MYAPSRPLPPEPLCTPAYPQSKGSFCYAMLRKMPLKRGELGGSWGNDSPRRAASPTRRPPPAAETRGAEVPALTRPFRRRGSLYARPEGRRLLAVRGSMPLPAMPLRAEARGKAAAYAAAPKRRLLIFLLDKGIGRYDVKKPKGLVCPIR